MSQAPPPAIAALAAADVRSRLAVVDSAGAIVWANSSWLQPAALPHLGGATMSRGADLRGALAAITTPARLRKAAADFLEVVDGKREVAEHRYRVRTEARDRWYWTRAIRREHGGARVTVFSHDNVTSEVRTRNELEQSHAGLKTLVTAAPVALLSLDAAGVVRSVEGVGALGLGVPISALLGKPIFNVYAHLPVLLDAVRGALRGDTTKATVVIGRTTFDMRWSPLLDDDGEIDGVVGVGSDVTDRVRLQRMKDEFVSVVSHELRTPLTSIRGSLGLLEGGVVGRLPDQAADLVRIARKNVDRLVRLINDMLDLDKIEAGRVNLSLETLSVDEILRHAMTEMQGMAADARVTLQLDSSEGLKVRADRDRLIQVLTNLLSNAIKYSPSGGGVRIGARHHGSNIRLQVTDRGPGIAAAKIARLFQRFEQVSSEDGIARPGTGLGLAISKAIVEAHHGTIGVTSKVGEGSTFFVELSANPARAAAASQPFLPAQRETVVESSAIENPLNVPLPQQATRLWATMAAYAETPCQQTLEDAQSAIRLLDASVATHADSELRQRVQSARLLLEQSADGSVSVEVKTAVTAVLDALNPA